MAEPDRAAPPTAEPRARAARARRRDAAALLPIAGVVLFASPLLDALTGPGSILGLPRGPTLVFLAWLALIAAAAALARRLARDLGGG